MDELQKIQFAANSFYNRGLELAKERDLSGASEYLKRALQLNKYHTDARNLLGLIFYEMGETSDALVQWVISVNLQPEENRADHYLDEVQAAHLLDLLDDEPIVYRTMITLLLHTGLRRGELCGLEWDDINFDLSLLDVQRTSLYLPEKGVFVDETKNSTSRRVLKLTPDAVQLLKRYRMWQNSERLRIGDQWAEEWEQRPRLFTTWDGKPLHPSTVTGWFHTFIERSDLPPILRHTNATLLIAAGTNLTTVAARLGHANSTTTSKIYAHAIKSADQAAAEVLQDILHPVKKQA